MTFSIRKFIVISFMASASLPISAVLAQDAMQDMGTIVPPVTDMISPVEAIDPTVVVTPIVEVFTPIVPGDITLDFDLNVDLTDLTDVTTLRDRFAGGLFDRGGAGFDPTSVLGALSDGGLSDGGLAHGINGASLVNGIEGLRGF